MGADTTNRAVAARGGRMRNRTRRMTAAPAACAGAFFSMPSLTGLTATGGAATSTATPATDSWTS